MPVQHINIAGVTTAIHLVWLPSLRAQSSYKCTPCKSRAIKRTSIKRTRGPKGHCRSPEYNQHFKNLTSEWNQKQEHFILHVSRSLLCIRFVAITFWTEEVFEKCHLLWWIGPGGNFYSLFGPKNTNLVEDVMILLPVKFCWIPFSGFRGKVKICLSQS